MDGVRLYKESSGWKKVAEYVGTGRSTAQCQKRWNHSVRYVELGLQKTINWSEDEVRATICMFAYAINGLLILSSCPMQVNRLHELVQQHTVAPVYSEELKRMRKGYVDWKTIGNELGFIPADCRDRWGMIQAAKLSRGPFTAEEDILIRQTVQEWSGGSKGLWTTLQKELARPRQTLLSRWRNVLSKQT